MKKMLIILVPLLLLACTERHIKNTIENIVPIAKDTYTVAFTGKKYGPTRAIIYKAANQFCQSQNKLFYPLKEDKKIGYSRANVDLNFQCLDPGDPSYKNFQLETTPEAATGAQKK